MELTLYLLTATEYPPLFATAATAFDAVDMFIHHFACGADHDSDADTVIEAVQGAGGRLHADGASVEPLDGDRCRSRGSLCPRLRERLPRPWHHPSP